MNLYSSGLAVFCFVIAYLAVKGVKFSLFEFTEWGIRRFDPESIPKHTRENQLCDRCAKIVEEAVEAERKKAVKFTKKS